MALCEDENVEGIMFCVSSMWMEDEMGGPCSTNGGEEERL
jgi:hypothetical protein